MIPHNATNTMPPKSGAYRIYQRRTRGTTIHWAYWDFEKFCWSSAYVTPIKPDFESMQKNGRLKWNSPDVMYHWIPQGGAA